MKICVQGLWHLGVVTAACLAEAGFETVGLTEDNEVARSLSDGRPAVFESGLPELIRKGISAGTLSFSADVKAVSSADLVWVTFDTPLNEDDVADVDFVLDRVANVFPHVKDGAVVLLSSQLPVGSTKRLAAHFASRASGRRASFAYSPENLRLGQAIDAFQKAERIVIGVDDGHARVIIEPVLSRFCSQLLWMNVESAEMVKHALNSYLATCIAFSNELATISDKLGANFTDVEQALRLDPRVGTKAYVRAGAAFGGGTLARDVLFLQGLAKQAGVTVPLVGAILASNANHASWVTRRLEEELGDLQGKRVGLLGLSYKPGTDAIRRSVSVDLGLAVAGCGATVMAYDPKVQALPASLAESIKVVANVPEVFSKADVVLVGTEWPEFRSLSFDELVPSMKRRLLIDQNGFLAKQIALVREPVDYVVLGRGV